MALAYKNRGITDADAGQAGKPAYDTGRRDAATTRTVMDRRATNSETVARVNHGTAGSQGGGNWAAHTAAHLSNYHRETPPDQKRRDQQLLGSMEKHLERTWPGAGKSMMQWIGQNHAGNPHLIAAMRDIATREEAHDAARGKARDAEHQAGKTPLPAVPGNQKSAIKHVTGNMLSKLKGMYK
jgi:hypothetical protein